MNWHPDIPEHVEPKPKVRSRLADAIDYDAYDDGRCKATTWGPARRPPAVALYRNYFGPGGFNRCIGPDGHANELHKDEWGHVFQQDHPTTGYKIVRREKAESPYAV